MKIKTYIAKDIIDAYKMKFNIDITDYFFGNDLINLYYDNKTGREYFSDKEVKPGDEHFYKKLSENIVDYYHTEKKEYDDALNLIKSNSSILEIGCGRGYFLKKLEKKNVISLGLELNQDAIKNKVCNSEIKNQLLEQFVIGIEKKFDYIIAFQLLEHLPSIDTFIDNLPKILKDDGSIIIGVPNNDFYLFKNDLEPLNFPPHHFQRFNKKSLINLLKSINFYPKTILIDKYYQYVIKNYVPNNKYHDFIYRISVFLLNKFLSLIIGHKNFNLLIEFKRNAK